MIIKKKRKISVDEGVEQLVPNQSREEVDSEQNEKDIDLFDLDNIDFKQRQERRKGDRRRGFRRIDDRNLISRAKEEANSIREAAAKEGYQRGLQDAAEDIQRVRESLESFLNAKQEVYETIAPDVLEISLDIAKKIIKKEMSENQEILLDNIKDILKSLSKEETKIMLKVNPSQAAMLKQEIPEIMNFAGLEAKVIIVPDENTMEGGCMLTTSNGVIDATIETQLEIISEALKGI